MNANTSAASLREGVATRAICPDVPDRIVQEPERRTITGLSRTSWFREVKAGRAPKGFRLTGSGGAVGWRLSDLMAWIDERSANREAA